MNPLILFFLVPGSFAAGALDNALQGFEAVKSFSAHFEQTIQSKASPKETTKGKVAIEKPGRLRWASETDGNFQILHGKKLTTVEPNPRTGKAIVEIHDNIQKSWDTRRLDFLMGGSSIPTHYKVSELGGTPDAVRVKLIPKDSPKEVYIAEIRRKDYALVSLTTESSESTVVIRFSKIQLNQKLSDSLFHYEPKSGDVVHKN